MNRITFHNGNNCLLFVFFSSDIDICKKRAEGNPSTLKLDHFFELFSNYPSPLEFKEAIFCGCDVGKGIVSVLEVSVE